MTKRIPEAILAAKAMHQKQSGMRGALATSVGFTERKSDILVSRGGEHRFTVAKVDLQTPLGIARFIGKYSGTSYGFVSKAAIAELIRLANPGNPTT